METLWEAGPTHPRLRADRVDVWRADLAPGGEDLRELLSDEEHGRAARFVREADGLRWAQAHGILRALLARYVDADPRALYFVEGPHGKPGLVGHDVRFNLSHSGDALLVAVARGQEIGVDVELPRRTTDHVAIARRILGDEQADRLAALDEPTREREFLRAWVRWEAVLKCRGTGIGGADDPTTASDPWVCELDVEPPAAAALAVTAGPVVVRCLQWPGAD